MGQPTAIRPSEVARRAAHGAVSLGGGQVAAQIVNIGGAIVLARLLTPAEFGLVGILTFFLALLTALGDLGLGMSLVRHTHEPTDAEYIAVSTFQQVVSVAVAAGALIATPIVVVAYDLDPASWWLFPVMALAILADSIRFLPLARLERQLAFERVAVVEIAQAAVFNTALLLLAVEGYRESCFPLAVVARSVVGASMAVSIGPRLGGWRWDWAAARRYLESGLPYRGVHLVNVLKTSLVPVFVGLMLGRASVGHLEWAAMVAGFPLTGLILLQRLYVASFSRLQDHPAELREFVQHTITVAHLVVAPVAIATLVLVDPIVRLVFGEVWLPAVPLFAWLWVGTLVVPTLAPLNGLLHALGQSRVVFRVTAAGTLATWVTGVPLALAFGEVGVAMGSLSLQLICLVIWRVARRAVPFRVFGRIAVIWTCAAAGGAVAWWMQATFPVATIPQLLTIGGASVVVYAVAVGIGGGVLMWPSGQVLAPAIRRRPDPAARVSDR